MTSSPEPPGQFQLHPWVTGRQFHSHQEPRPFLREDNGGNMLITCDTLLQNHWANFNQT